MSKTTFLGYVPSLKSKHEATIVGGKAIESKGGSIRYMLEGEYDGRKTLPKTVSKADFESVYGFDAKEAEGVLIYGTGGDGGEFRYHEVGREEKDGFTPETIEGVHPDGSYERVSSNQKNYVEADTDAKEAEAVYIAGMKDGFRENKLFRVGKTKSDGFTPKLIEPIDKEAVEKIEKMADTVGNPSPASVEPPAPSEKPFPQEPSNENFSAEYTEDDICFVCSNPDTENEVTYCESDADCGKAICDDCRYEEMQGGKWVILDEDPEDDNSAMADVCRECADNNEPVLFEAFGFGKDEEEEEEEVEEPKTKEFTVVLQEGDKLELTDIPDEEEPEQEDDSPATEEPKEENKDETDENEEDVKESDVLAKVTRPIQEEEEKLEDDEEGSVDLGTVAKVGAIGLTALTLGNVLFAEDEEPFAFNADTDYTDIYGRRAEGSGQIDHDSIDTIEDTEVHFRHDYPTTHYEWTTADDLTDEEEDMVDDEVRWDIGSEPEEGQDSHSVDVQDVGTVNYTKDTDYGDKRFYGLAAEGGNTDATVVWELMQQNFNNPEAVQLYFTTIFGWDEAMLAHAKPSHEVMVGAVAEAVQQNYNDPIFMHYLAKEFGFEIQEAEDFQKMTSSEFVPFDQMQEELGQMWDETTAPLADAHNYDYEPSNEPTNANFSADTYIDLSPFKQRIANGASAKNVIETYRIHGKEDRKELMDYERRLYETETVGSPSPSGPSSIPEPAEATGSEPSNENMVKAADTKMAIGLTLAGVGLAVVLGKDRLSKWMDRFGL